MAFDMMDEDKKKMHKDMLRALKDEMSSPDLMEEPKMLDAEEVSPELAEDLKEGVEDVEEASMGLMEEAEDKGMLEPLEEREGELVVRTDDPELMKEIKDLIEEKLMSKKEEM